MISLGILFRKCDIMLSYCFNFLYSYLFEGFIHLQKLINEAIMEWKANTLNKSYHPIDVSVRVRKMYFQCIKMYIYPMEFVMGRLDASKCS